MNLVLESQIQADIMANAKKLGYFCLSTSGHQRGRLVGPCKGVPDLLLAHKCYPVGAWLGIEVKKPKGTLKPEQQELLEAGRIVVARSWDEAWAAIRSFERATLNTSELHRLKMARDPFGVDA